MKLSEYLAQVGNQHTQQGNPHIKCDALYKTAKSLNCHLTPTQAIEFARCLLQKAQLILENNIEDANVQVWTAGEHKKSLYFGLTVASKAQQHKKASHRKKGPRRKKGSGAGSTDAKSPEDSQPEVAERMPQQSPYGTPEDPDGKYTGSKDLVKWLKNDAVSWDKDGRAFQDLWNDKGKVIGRHYLSPNEIMEYEKRQNVLRRAIGEPEVVAVATGDDYHQTSQEVVAKVPNDSRDSETMTAQEERV